MQWPLGGGQRRDVVFDVTPVVVLLIVGLWDVVQELSTPYGDGPWQSAVGPVIIACLALLGRRTWPLLALGIVLAVLVLPGLVTPTRLTYWGEYVVWLVAMYSAGRHLPWRRGLWAIAMSVVAYAIALAHYPRMRDVDTTLFNAGLLVGLWVLGRLAAGWTTYRERTIRLEFERAQTEERAAVRERARIARELHDVISHTITVIVMQAGGARLASSSDPTVATEALARIEDLGRSSLAELRTLLEVLRGDDPDATGTAPQPTLADVDELCTRMRGLGLPVRLRRQGATDDLPAAVQLTGYRVVQEGLTNVLKHAGTVPTEVVVDHAQSSRELVVEVSSAPGGQAAGLPGGINGLTGLRERVDAVGGTLTMGFGPDGRFVVSALLPVAVRTR